eukprot:scaffold50486_cov76-Phaeocystis_antarctica.AAC.5
MAKVERQSVAAAPPPKQCKITKYRRVARSTTSTAGPFNALAPDPVKTRRGVVARCPEPHRLDAGHVASARPSDTLAVIGACYTGAHMCRSSHHRARASACRRGSSVCCSSSAAVQAWMKPKSVH